MDDSWHESDVPDWKSAQAALSAAGFSDVAVINPRSLPGPLQHKLGIEPGDRLVAVGTSGARFWQQLQGSRFAGSSDPIDDYSAAVVQGVLEACGEIDACELRYPGDGVAPLMQIGHWLGWTSPSPLGLGVHPSHGLWFAWRALAVVTLASPDLLPITLPDALASPCLSCADTPCVSQCPAGAVALEHDFAIGSCVAFRSRAGSSCAESCHSRLACPVGGASRYPVAQFAYHQRRALDGMQRWLRRNDDE